MDDPLKIDIHNHILPERWPDLKEVCVVKLVPPITVFVEIRLRRVDTAAPSLQGQGAHDAGRQAV